MIIWQNIYESCSLREEIWILKITYRNWLQEYFLNDHNCRADLFFSLPDSWLWSCGKILILFISLKQTVECKDKGDNLMRFPCSTPIKRNNSICMELRGMVSKVCLHLTCKSFMQNLLLYRRIKSFWSILNNCGA